MSATGWAYLTQDLNSQVKGIPTLSFHLKEWVGVPEAGVKNVMLTLYECDYPDPPRLGAQPTSKDQIAKVRFNLEKNDQEAEEGKPEPPPWKISRAKVLAQHVGPGRRKKDGDFALYLGGKTSFKLQVPQPAGDIHQEGEYWEVGFTLEHDSVQPIEELGNGMTGRLPLDSVADMLKLHIKPTGGMSTANGGAHDPKTVKLGRFNGPGRNPQVDPEDAATPKMLEKVKEALKSPPADLDGLRFENFLIDRHKRREFVEELTAKITLAPCKPQHELALSTGDFQKAFFIIHDVGWEVDSQKSKTLGSATHSRNMSNVRAKAGVHGYVNMDGSLVLVKDFAYRRGAGVVYSSVSMGKWLHDYVIGLETFPGGTLTQPEADEQIACVGWGSDWKTKKEAWFRWTKNLVGGLADLYILASARANHLLTVTCHVECDRNLSHSQVFHEYGKATLQSKAAGSDLWDKIYNRPQDMHGDPYGLDLQVLYDAITERLNTMEGLGRWKLPATGIRYGMHPERLFEGTKKDSKGYRKVQRTGDSQLHSFPWQSEQEIGTLAKKGVPKEKAKKKTKKKK